jgi:fatty acid desaturase
LASFLQAVIRTERTAAAAAAVTLVAAAAVLAVYLFAICFPFYSAINSLMTGLTSPLIYYTIPCVAFLKHYRHQENRDKCPYNLAR